MARCGCGPTGTNSASTVMDLTGSMLSLYSPIREAGYVTVAGSLAFALSEAVQFGAGAVCSHRIRAAR